MSNVCNPKNSDNCVSYYQPLFLTSVGISTGPVAAWILATTDRKSIYSSRWSRRIG